MNRALSSTCLAALVLCLGGVANAKPSIAVLGLEVVDQSGTPTPTDTQVARELTDGLRSRAKTPSGPYSFAIGSEKELIDEKLLKNCDSETISCMVSIASDLGADILLFGKIEKGPSKAYIVTLKLLDVRKHAISHWSNDQIPISEASGPELQGWAKKIYSKLTGQNDTGTLVLHVANADRGTILIDGEEKANINNGSGTVSGLDPGKYRVEVESEGFKRWSADGGVTIRAGDQTTVTAKLEKKTDDSVAIGPGEGPGPGPGLGTGPGPGPEHPPRGSPGWRTAFYASIVVGLAGGAVWVYGYNQGKDAYNTLCQGGGFADNSADVTKGGCMTHMGAGSNALSEGQISTYNHREDRAQNMTLAGGISVGIAGGFAVFALIKGFVAKHDDEPAERSDRGHYVHRDRFVVVPIVSPTTGGATLMFDW